MVSKSTDEVEARTKRNYSKASREGDRRRPFQSELPPKLSAFFSSRKCSSIPAKSWHFCPKTCTSIFYELFIALIPYSWQKGDVLRGIYGQYIVSIWYTCYRDILSFTNFYSASIIRLIKGCDWEEELAVLCLYSYSTKKTLPLVIWFHFKMKWPSDKNLNETKRVQKNKNANGARKEMAHYVFYIKGFKRDWYLLSRSLAEISSTQSC